MPPTRRPATDHLPPHSSADEQAVIGCQLADPNQRIAEVFTRLGGDAAAFYDLRHQTIQTTLWEMWNGQEPVDLITVTGRLRDKNLIDQIGGMPYLAECQDMPPSAHHLPAYLDSVIEKHLLRKVINTCTSTVATIYDDQTDVQALIDSFERDVLAIRKIKGGGEVKSIKQVVQEALTDIETVYNSGGKISGISTGIPDLDQETDGLHAADYILIAAFPSVGKTSLAMNIVENVAIDQGLPVGVFSAEMSARSLAKRSITSRSRVNMRDIRKQQVTQADFIRMQVAAQRLAASNLIIDDTSDMSIQQVRAKGRRMKQQHPKLALIVADYAQMFRSPGAENHTMELDQVSKGFKNMAKELNVPVIVLSQLTEDAKGNVHLKGARALGEDADGYWQLKRPKNATEDASQATEPIELWLRKQRNEARNVCIPLTFFKTFTRFEQAAKIPDDNQPETRQYQPD